MQSFKAASTNPEFYSLSSYFRRDDSDRNQTRFTDLGELEQSATAFPHDDAVVLSPSSMFGLKANNVGGVPDSLHYGTLNVGGCLDIGSTITGTGGRGCVDTGQQQPYMYQQQKGTTTSGNGQFENWGDNSAMADNSQQTDTYTDVDTDDKNHHGALMVVDSTEQAKERTTGDQKTLRRLAQNGEAARKSRLRKKVIALTIDTVKNHQSLPEMAFQRPTINISTLPPNAAYQDIAGSQPSIQGIPERDWNDADIDLVKMWHNVQMLDANILTTGATWHAQIMAENEISAQTAIMGLQLAMSLKSMDPRRTAPLLTLPVRGPALAGSVPAAVNLPALNSFGSTPFTVRAQQVIAGPVAPNLPIAAAAAAGAIPVNAPPPPVPAGTDTEAERRFAYTFLAAYLIKLLVKSPENVVRGIDNMRSRYESFYGPSRLITGFTFTVQKAFAYKEALLSQSNILTTYTMALAYTQVVATGEQTVKESGVLSYLGYLPFSYTGMHAYTLIIELRNVTNVPLDKLLTLFQADVTAAALNKIALIVRSYKRTVAAPDRSTYFRYCAAWGSQYFLSLRSSKCPHLLYTAACAWKTLAAGTENADPENIMASMRLSDPMKRTLKNAGEIIGESLKVKHVRRGECIKCIYNGSGCTPTSTSQQ